MTLAGEDTLSLVVVRPAARTPPLRDLFLPAEVALRAHIVEDRVVPVGVLDEELLLGPALLAVLLLLPDLLPAEHWTRPSGSRYLNVRPRIRRRVRPHRAVRVQAGERGEGAAPPPGPRSLHRCVPRMREGVPRLADPRADA